METKVIDLHLVLPGRDETCLRCVERLKGYLLELKGVYSVDVDEEKSLLSLRTNPLLIPMERVEEKVRQVGLEITERFVHQTMELTGMDCVDCAEKIEGVLSRMEGVIWVNVNFTTGRIAVEFDSHKIDLKDIISKIEGLGYGVRRDVLSGAKTSTFFISGMDCAEKAHTLERTISSLKGLKDYRIDLMGSKLIARHMPYELPTKAILDAIKSAGLVARIEEEGKVEGIFRREKRLITTALSGILLFTGFLLFLLDLPEGLIALLYALSILIGGYPIAKSGLLALRHLSLDINFLMTIAVLGAGIIGEWLEGATVTFLFATANLLESFSMERARRAINALIEVSPRHTVVLRDGKEVFLPVEDVKVGEVMLVKPGEKIALDGRVIKGASTVNQSPITGESLPVGKRTGDYVFAGTINIDGSLYVEVTHSAKDTTLSKIIHLVKEAQASKAPTQSFVERFARYYTPLVIMVAVLVVAIPTLFLSQPFTDWFYRGLVLLVIACPCALVISTPVSIVSGLASAARNGVLIKGGVYLEEVGNLKAIVFDKTGTLTKGEPKVLEVVPFNDMEANEILRIAASVEAGSEHPIATAIIEKAKEKGIKVSRGENFQSISGKGARAKVDARFYYIGNHRMFNEMGLSTPEIKERLELLEVEGKTVVIVGDEERIIGLITLSDMVREEAKEAIKGLSANGIERVVMLTGDNLLTAAEVAKRLGIEEYRAQLLPQDKVNVIKELLGRYKKVGVVGDGVNDAPALALATVGIAMGVAGTDVALETADIALMSDDLSRLPFLYSLGRRTLRVIKTNITFALLLKALFLVLAIPGLATLWMAVVADMGASLLVIFNGLRLFKRG